VAALLCQYNADVELVDRRQETAMHLACRGGHGECVQFLVESAASVTPANCDGDTPLHIAAWEGNLEICRTLVEYGADVHHRNGRHQTAYSNVLSRQVRAACLRACVLACLRACVLACLRACVLGSRRVRAFRAACVSRGLSDALSAHRGLASLPALPLARKRASGFAVVANAFAPL
jgi:hypothetical protein